MEDLIPAKIVQVGCQECLGDLVKEAKSAGYNLEGKVVLIPERWLEMPCPHGNVGLKFEGVPVASDEEVYEEVASEPLEACEVFDTRMDATKNLGFPAREFPCTTQRYGSTPMYDPFDDESSPDGSGTY
jgi:hypothetical protein